jgi:D-3-phosphoglycerate dehydrogenase
MERETIAWTTSSWNTPFPEHLDVVGNPYGRTMAAEEIAGFLGEHNPSGLIAGLEPLTDETLQRAPSLRVISRCGVGIDNVDTEAARSRGIDVYNTPDAPVQAVAELTVALMLSLLRHVPAHDTGLHERKWERMTGSLLSGMTVGIVGCGRIGTRVAEILSVIGCTLLGYHPSRRIHPVCKLVPLWTILAESDIVSVHVPLTPDTRGMIGREEISKMKRTAFLINTSRGPVVDEAALVDSLQAGTIGGAGIDVFESEPYTGPLTDVDGNVVLTPHIGSRTGETRARMEREALENLIRGLEATHGDSHR